MRFRWIAAALLIVAASFGIGFATPITHITGVDAATSEPFEAGGTWAVTLAAYCFEGIGFVEARVFNEDHEEIGLVTVMGEGIERLVFDTDPGEFYIEVEPSHWHIYNWEVLVEPGEGSEYKVGEDLLVVSHEDHMAATEEDQAAADAAAAMEPAARLDIWDGIFTLEQAERGRQTYQVQCAGCHGSDLTSTDEYAPDLTGFLFTSRWYGKTVAERFTRIQMTMPLGAPGTLTDEQVVDILAHIFNQNDFPVGEAELAAGPHLEQIGVGPQD